MASVLFLFCSIVVFLRCLASQEAHELLERVRRCQPIRRADFRIGELFRSGLARHAGNPGSVLNGWREVKALPRPLACAHRSEEGLFVFADRPRIIGRRATNGRAVWAAANCRGQQGWGLDTCFA